MTRPFTLQASSYKVCLDCGRKFPYSLEKMRTLHSWEIARLTPQSQQELPQLAPVALTSAFAQEEDYQASRAVA